jgi:hypothetical protein
VNVNAIDVNRSMEFYATVLGMIPTDRSKLMGFVRCNADHHAIVLADAKVNGLNHIAFMRPDLESVMGGAGNLVSAGVPIAWGVGRHVAPFTASQHFGADGTLIRRIDMVPPFIGQGMCQGLRDVANLSWRIAHVLAGRAGPGLFESYGAERGAHVRRLTGRIKAIGQVICERDKVRAAARDARILAEGVLARWFDRHDCRAALVRPDHYVFGVAGADGAAALVRRLSCRLEAMSPVRTQAVA